MNVTQIDKIIFVTFGTNSFTFTSDAETFLAEKVEGSNAVKITLG